MGRYIDPRTDFGFKRLFGQEDSKDILKQFLFDVLALPHPIQELTFIPPEQLSHSLEDRRGIYDVHCVDTMGRRFIVDIHQGTQAYSKERVLYHAMLALTYPTDRWTGWQPDSLPVYCLVVLAYQLSLFQDHQYWRCIQLVDTETGTIFYDKLTFTYVELVKFNRSLAEASPADKWFYLLKKMVEMENIPEEFSLEPFQTAFAVARESALSPEDRWYYEGSLKQARDFNAQLVATRQRGWEEGRRLASQEKPML